MTGEVVAVKQIPRRLMTTPRLQAEVDLLRMAGQHKNVVGFRDLFSDSNFYYIVMGEREREKGGEGVGLGEGVVCTLMCMYARYLVCTANMSLCTTEAGNFPCTRNA